MDRFYVILIVIFCGVNGLGIAYSHLLQDWGVNSIAGMVANVILAVITALSYYFGMKGIKGENQHAFTRQVYVATFGKLFVCAIGVLIYAFLFRRNIRLGTIVMFFVLYIIYTLLETMSLSKAAKSSSS